MLFIILLNSNPTTCLCINGNTCDFVADKKGQSSVANGKIKEEPVSVIPCLGRT